MAESIRTDALARSISEWAEMASVVSKSYVPLIQQIAQSASRSNTAFAASVLQFKLTHGSALQEMAVGMAKIRESLNPATLMFAELAKQYHEALSPLVIGLTSFKQSLPARLQQEIQTAPAALVEHVAAYAEHNPSVIIMDEDGEETRVSDLVQRLQTQVDGLHAKADEMKEAGTRSNKKNLYITLILFILSIYVPQLLFVNGAADKAREDLQKGVAAVIQTLHFDNESKE